MEKRKSLGGSLGGRGLEIPFLHWWRAMNCAAGHRMRAEWPFRSARGTPSMVAVRPDGQGKI